MINVTKTYLPPLEEYVEYLERIWASHQVTNNGPLVKELEARLKEYLGVKHLFFVSNGTIALQIAIRALDLHGEIITTPFSYVATTSSIVWEGCRPVFVDIDPDTLCLDPDRIEAAITPRTSAILAVHIYGIPCDVEKIQAIANKHDLKVIYDAAHAFSVCYKGQSLLNHGDIATLSFHATKLFHTVEGGAIITQNDELAHRISYMRNFGHKGEEDFWGLGINGKTSEFHAAMGLCLLPKFPQLLARCKAISESYDELCHDCSISRPKYRYGTVHNYAYYPILFDSEESLLGARAFLNLNGINPRRYFYPALNLLPYVSCNEKFLAEDISKRVLCLPLYADLESEDVLRICNIIRSIF